MIWSFFEEVGSSFGDPGTLGRPEKIDCDLEPVDNFLPKSGTNGRPSMIRSFIEKVGSSFWDPGTLGRPEKIDRDLEPVDNFLSKLGSTGRPSIITSCPEPVSVSFKPWVKSDRVRYQRSA